MSSDFTDYHCHLLPALDDGAVDLRESLDMARTLCSFGFATVHCTPHLIRGGYENEPARVIRAVHIMQRRLDEEGIPLHLVPGNEHYLDQYLPEMLPGALRAGTSRYLLVEVPFHAGTELLRPMVQTFSRHGLAPLIAHPERCAAFDPATAGGGFRVALSLVFGKEPEHQMGDSEIVALKRLGCRFQGNLGSFAGYYGYEVRERALLFLRHGLYSCLGTDAHRGEHLWDMLVAGYAVVESVLGEQESRDLLRGTHLANGA
ncbi:phosphoesterase [Geomonas nitrogeniifigens]|uniref:protein-tyrosine-phosphatase n=1 Tax=Geomonas diazotrophica TaxID=2843197 RepID=A0ABX8JLF5_9BACT|nr:CpsB/CapC family capsule biosynthesis tyrosine phosphatase [Geomonas nitrogeniifigens]QWV99214.1 phosphoesterase [Geomonas nitrogeniifigens]QXE88383.1 phosphoesterase [Geomonas nitrogeniifigens]